MDLAANSSIVYLSSLSNWKLIAIGVDSSLET